MTNTSKFWVGALIVGAVGVGAVVANRNRVVVTPAVPIAATEVAPPVETKAALPMPKPQKAGAEPIVVTAGLETLVKPLLQKGTDLAMASEGFTSSATFVATAHAAKNLDVPFVLLKDRVVAQRMSLEAAIRDLKPGADAKAEAARAISEARSEITRPM